MKILFITIYDPFDVHCGGSVRNRFLWEALNKCGEVWTSVLKSDIEPHLDRKHRIAYVAPCEAMISSRAATFLRAVFSVSPDGAFAARSQILSALGWPDLSFDCVVVRFLSMVTHVAAWKIAPVIADIDDLPSEDFETMRRPHMSWFAGMFQSWCVRRWEYFRLKMCAAAWLPNPLQLDRVRKVCKCELLPNVVRAIPDDYDVGITRKRQLMTVASFAYEPNVEGVDWFLREVWPGVRVRYADLEYVIAGYGMSEQLTTQWKSIPGVRVLGFVDSLDQLYAESLAVVVPVFSGGGTAVKVIEALSYGRRVLATPFGLRGLSAEQKRRASLDEFVDADGFLSKLAECIDNDKGRTVSAAMRQVYREGFSQEFFRSQVCKGVELTRSSLGWYNVS